MAITRAEPCPNSDSFSIVHEWVSKKAWRDGSLRMDWLDLVDKISRDRALSCGEISDALASLLDQGIMRSTDDGFLVTEKFEEKFRISPREARERASLVAQRLDLARTPATQSAAQYHGVLQSEAHTTDGMSDPSVRTQVTGGKPRVRLCQNVFPSLVERHGMETIHREMYWKALYKNVQRLELEYRVNTPFVRRMMEEFVRHPDWCQRSSRPAWRVFISRWQQLYKMVQVYDHNDTRANPGGTSYWLGSDFA